MKTLTAKQYLEQHPEKYVLCTYEFGYFMYVAKIENKTTVTDNINDAEIWSALDNTDIKLKYFSALTGYKNLQFIQL